jgi:hypothetical protein
MEVDPIRGYDEQFAAWELPVEFHLQHSASSRAPKPPRDWHVWNFSFYFINFKNLI